MHRVLRSSMLLRMGVLATAPLLAHDMWIEPTTFSPQTGEIVGVKLRVGQDLLGDPLPRNPALINQFIVEDSEGRKPLVGHDGSDPAGFLRVAAPGLLVIGYNSNPSSVELTPEKFNQYLREEGLDTIAALRASRNETGAKAREMFSRCAKSLVLSGPASESAGDRRLGFTLELVAERNPYTLRAGQDLPVRLTYESRPLSGALVVAMNRSRSPTLDPAMKAAHGNCAAIFCNSAMLTGLYCVVGSRCCSRVQLASASAVSKRRRRCLIAPSKSSRMRR